MLNNFLFHHPFASLIRDAEETSESCLKINSPLKILPLFKGNFLAYPTLNLLEKHLNLWNRMSKGVGSAVDSCCAL
ncbi:MAG: hypothetical protein CO171_04560 [Syntrophobacterales bacterium CG_4_9_14_3_um_filter_49_8]|nr:MAG: hypothetical protein CO171_04560 [Syntrophobacterales bacterium CG_4_9_14_3_um_filter_49_8]